MREKHGKGLMQVVSKPYVWREVLLGTGLGKLQRRGQREKLKIAYEICQREGVHSERVLQQIQSRL